MTERLATLHDDDGAPRVSRVATTNLATYFRVAAGKKGGREVSVRVGQHNVFCCLTCLVTTCEHCDLAREFDAVNPEVPYLPQPAAT